MSMDQQLRAALRKESEMQQAPQLDLDSVVFGGTVRRRRRNVRRAAGMVLAAAVITAGTVAVLNTDDGQDIVQPIERPATVEDLGIGAKPAMPYCESGEIRGAGATFAADCTTLISRGGSTISWNDGGVYVVADGQQRQIDSRPPSDWVPAVSPDGKYAVWVSDKAGAQLVVHSLPDGDLVAELPMPTAQGWLAGVDSLNRAYYIEFSGDRAWAYDISAGKLVRIKHLPAYSGAGITFVSADGIGIDRGPFGPIPVGQSELGSVSEDGTFESHGLVKIGWSSWSPDFSRFVQETQGGWWVQSPDDLANHVLVNLPRAGKPSLNPVWESNDSLLFTFFPKATWTSAYRGAFNGDVPSTGSYILRCSATTGDCEVALGPGYAGDMQGPMFQ
jgi:hypothetical protein